MRAIGKPRLEILLVLLIAAAVNSQTIFRKGSAPVTSAGSLPSTCNMGTVFFLVSTTPGQNLYGCTAPDIWTLEAGSGGGGGGNATPALTPIAFSSTPSFPIGNTTQGFTLTLAGSVSSSAFSGSPTDGQEVWFRICQDSTGGRTFVFPTSMDGADPVDTLANACTSQTFKYIAASTSYVAVSGGQSDAITPGLTTNVGTLNLPTPAGAATITQTVASGATALGTSSIASQACATVVTATAMGAVSTDIISITPNASVKAVTGFTATTTGGLTVSWYPSTNAVSFDVCNWSASPITPGAVTFNWRVFR